MQSPTNSANAPSPSGSRKRSSAERSQEARNFASTAIWLGLGRALPRRRSEQHGFIALGKDDDPGGDRPRPRASMTRPDSSRDQRSSGDAADVLGARVLSLLSKPLVRGPRMSKSLPSSASSEEVKSMVISDFESSMAMRSCVILRSTGASDSKSRKLALESGVDRPAGHVSWRRRSCRARPGPDCRRMRPRKPATPPAAARSRR